MSAAVGQIPFSIISIVLEAAVGAVVSALYEFIDTKGLGIIPWFESQFKFRDKDVYLSFAYLYRIQVDGKYLLVRGNRMKDRYQPIGGVYKYYAEAKPELEKLGYNPDVTMGNVDETDDLRLHLRGKKVPSFFEWFSKMQNREYDPCREFYEELIETGLLSEADFKKLKYRKVGTHNVGFTYFVGAENKSNRRPEFIYADIFELQLTEQQQECIREAILKNPGALCLATIEEIRSRRYNNSVEMNVGNNAVWILGEV